MTMGGDDSDGVTALVSATLAMAVLSLLFALIMTFIVAVVLYHLIKLKGEVRRLRYSGELSLSLFAFSELTVCCDSSMQY